MFNRSKKIKESFGADAVKSILQSRLTDDGRNIRRFTSKEKAPRGFYFNSLTSGVDPVGEVSYNGEDFVFRVHNGKVYVMPSSKAGWNWSETIYKMEEGFEAGKANMEYPDYEIKITGQVPIDYAKAIDDRQKRVEKIEDDFKEKDKIEDEFEKETAQHKEIKETLNMQNKYLKESVYDELVQDLKENGFEVYNIDEVDEETKEDMKASKAKIAIYFPEAARTWFFTDEDSMVIYFKNGGKLDVNKTGLVEAIPNEIAEEPKKRIRSKNRNAEDKMYSSDDKWLQVYDDLSSEVDNEGPKGEVNKQVKIPRGKRFSGPYAGPGDYDLTVYATNRDDLKWAEKIADHYGVDIDIKEDKSKNVYYPWYAILRDIR